MRHLAVVSEAAVRRLSSIVQCLLWQLLITPQRINRLPSKICSLFSVELREFRNSPRINLILTSQAPITASTTEPWRSRFLRYVISKPEGKSCSTVCFLPVIDNLVLIWLFVQMLARSSSRMPAAPISKSIEGLLVLVHPALPLVQPIAASMRSLT